MHLLPPCRRLLHWLQWDSATRLFALAAAILLFGAAPAMAQHVIISHADQPARLIRKAMVHQAPQGVRLQVGDVIESGAEPVQVEWPNGARLALGPASSILLGGGGAAPSISLLRGWAKFATTAPGGGRLALDAGLLGLQAAGASGIVHLASDKTELFVETGAVQASDSGNTAAAPATVGREQYAVRLGARPLAVAPRAPRLFLDRLPRAFFDPLVAVSARARPVTPTAQRPIAAADVAAWRDAGLPVRTRLARQLSPRLADITFRNEIEDMIDAHPEWRDLLRRQRAAAGRANSPLNYLF